MTASNKKLMARYMTVADLERKAKRRLPHIAWEYLESGTGLDTSARSNLTDLERVTLTPRFMRGEFVANTETNLFGRRYAAPFGIAPVGFPGLVWPKAEQFLAKAATKHSIPFTLTTVGTQTPETIGPYAGDMGWFQLYPPRKDAIRHDLLQRARDNGFHTLVVTADVPTPSRRERPRRAGLGMPPKVTWRFLWQAALHPAWTLRTLRAGLPRLVTMDKYVDKRDLGEVLAFIANNLGGTLSWDYLRKLRDEWSGAIVIKGILHPDDAEKAVSIGVDGIAVSNHGGRQFDGAPSAIAALPAVVAQVNGRIAVLFDGGVRCGLDVLRALALGADFVLLGRAFMFGLAALGDRGADHTAEILLEEITNNMMQLGCATVADVRALRDDVATRTTTASGFVVA